MTSVQGIVISVCGTGLLYSHRLISLWQIGGCLNGEVYIALEVA